MKPLRPCSWCGSTRFGVIATLQMAVTSDAKRAFGNTLEAEFEVVICMYCDATHFFAKRLANDSHLLDACKHEIVDVEPPSPYR